MRQGTVYRERIAEILETIVETTSLNHIRILQEGNDIADIGTVKPPLTEGENGWLLDQETYWLWKTIQLQNHAPSGQGRGWGWQRSQANDLAVVDMTGHDQQLLIGLQTESFKARMEENRHRTFLLLATGTTAIIVLVAAWIFMLRNRDLTLQLDRQNQRNEHLYELQLAGAGLAHETKNPLGIIRGLAQQVSTDTTTSEPIRRKAEDIMEQADTATARLGEFLAFSKIRKPSPTATSLLDVAARICELMEVDAQEAGVVIRNEIPTGFIQADSGMLTQVITNLLANAIQACRPEDHITLSGVFQGNSAQFSMTDTGRGIASELLPDIFKPYVSGRSEGHGLGLAIIRRIVEDHAWEIQIESEENRGTRVCIRHIQHVQEESS